MTIFTIALAITIPTVRYLEVQRDYQRLKDSLPRFNREYIQLKEDFTELKKEKTFKSLDVEVTAYSPDLNQTWGNNPFEMASTLIVTPNDLWQLKYIAVSRDLKADYNLKWGDKIFVEFEVQDLMGGTANGKITEKTIDIFMRSQEIALNFGRQNRRVLISTNE